MYSFKKFSSIIFIIWFTVWVYNLKTNFAKTISLIYAVVVWVVWHSKTATDFHVNCSKASCFVLHNRTTKVFKMVTKEHFIIKTWCFWAVCVKISCSFWVSNHSKYYCVNKGNGFCKIYAVLYHYCGLSTFF